MYIPFTLTGERVSSKNIDGIIELIILYLIFIKLTKLTLLCSEEMILCYCISYFVHLVGFMAHDKFSKMCNSQFIKSVESQIHQN